MISKQLYIYFPVTYTLWRAISHDVYLVHLIIVLQIHSDTQTQVYEENLH